MDLLCVNPLAISMLFCLLKILEGVSGFALSSVTDRWGRRKSALIFLGISLVSQAMMLLMSSYSARLIAFILMGVSNSKNSVLYVWLFELVESKSKPAACTMLNLIDASTMVVFGLYLLFVSKHWFPLYFGTLCVTSIAFTLIALSMPESPKWLLINKTQKEAIEQLNYIGRFNKSSASLPAYA